jgi:hypothetical protein
MAGKEYARTSRASVNPFRTIPRKSKGSRRYVKPEQLLLNNPATVVPSPEEVLSKRKGTGGWKRAQLAEWGVPWPPPKGWMRCLEEQYRRTRLTAALEAENFCPHCGGLLKGRRTA